MIRKFILHQNATVQSVFIKYAFPLLSDSKVQEMGEYIQHGNTSCLEHCLAVAYYSLVFFLFLRISCDFASLIRGALLHDYFLYDWHTRKLTDKKGIHLFQLHGFTHAQTAYENASKDFDLSRKSCDIIQKHMFPLTLTPPRCKESIVVSCVDKVCSVYEVFSRKGYKPLKEIENTVKLSK